MTISEFYTELNDLVISKFSSVSNSKKLRYLNRAILNTFKDLKYFNADVYNKTTSLVCNDGVITLPSDFNTDDHNDFILFYDEERRNIAVNYRVFGGTLRTTKGDNETYYIEYTKTPSVYTDMSEELLEANNRRAFELLQSEIEYIRDTDIYQGQTSAQAQSARVRANELS